MEAPSRTSGQLPIFLTGEPNQTQAAPPALEMLKIVHGEDAYKDGSPMKGCVKADMVNVIKEERNRTEEDGALLLSDRKIRDTPVYVMASIAPWGEEDIAIYVANQASCEAIRDETSRWIWDREGKYARFWKRENGLPGGFDE